MAKISQIQKDKDDLIKRLKDELISLRDKFNTKSEQVKEFPEIGFGVCLNEKNEFCLARIKYNSKGSNAVLESITSLGKDMNSAEFLIRKVITEEIFLKLMRQK